MRKKRNKAKKGGQYERELSRDISLWMSHGKNDNCVWRSSNSGGRATVRAKTGKETKEHASDFSAVNKIGRMFLRRFTPELKRGYNAKGNVFINDCVTAAERKVHTLRDWIKQVQRCQKKTGTPHWILIHRPDNRKAIVYMDLPAFRVVCRLAKDPNNFGQFSLGRSPKFKNMGFMPLDMFLSCNPDTLFEELKP